VISGDRPGDSFAVTDSALLVRGGVTCHRQSSLPRRRRFLIIMTRKPKTRQINRVTKTMYLERMILTLGVV